MEEVWCVETMIFDIVKDMYSEKALFQLTWADSGVLIWIWG